MRTKKKQCGDKIYYEICECGLKTIHLLLYKLFVLGDIMWCLKKLKQDCDVSKNGTRSHIILRFQSWPSI